MRRLVFLVSAAWLAAAPLLAQETAPDVVAVPGSKTTYAASFVHSEGVAPLVTKTTLTLTGAGMRTKLWVNAYTIGSYVDARATVPTAEALIGTPHLKQLRLVFERDLPGALMASSIVTSIRKVDPKKRFEKEVSKLEAYLAAKSVKRGDVVLLTHVPKQGLRAQVAKLPPLAIGGDAFARAVWKIYFGKAPLQEKLKQALLARLKRSAGSGKDE